MKETVRAFEERTRSSYDPPAFLRALGRPLAPRDACPTLFRYPGPEGLRDLLTGALQRLAPLERDAVWLASAPRGVRPRAVGLFGTVAVLQPLRLAPCATGERGVYIGLNAALADLELVAWVPPSAVVRRIGWDALETAAAAARQFGPRYAEERAAVFDRLGAYLEELSELHRAGAPGPTRPWCDVPARERRRLVEQYGVRPRWTAP